MKKLLSLLSVLTIGGTTVPTTIASSSYQKKEIIKNSNINYQQTNNLENLNREKRQNNEQNTFGIMTKFIGKPGSFHTSGVILNNKIYTGSLDTKVYEYDPATEQQKTVINTSASIFHSGLALNNKLYVGSGFKVYEYDPATEQQKTVITTDDNVTSSGIALNDRIYVGSGHKVYEYDPATEYQKEVITTDDNVTSLGIALNDRIYVGSGFKVYEYDPATEQQKTVINTPSTTYNKGLSLNNELYIWSYSGSEIYCYDPLELIESDIIDMKEQIKRGLYLNYKKQNPNSEIKNILNINLENLIVSDVIIEQTQKNKSSNLEQDINDFCKDSNSTFINENSIEQTQNTVSCSKQLTETNTFQKMNGFSKSETTSHTDNWSWNVNTKVTAKYSAEGGVPLVIKNKIEVGVEVGAGHNWGGSKNYTIGEVTNSSNTEIKTTTETMTINIPSQPVKIKPHSKVSIYVNAWKNNIKLILSYYQKVQGMVSAYFIDKNNNRITVSISIKDAMLNLQENNILPSKIKINDNDSINFSYDIKSEKEIIMHQTEIGESIPLSS